jgi:DNA repair protein SbcD/Mre11
MKTETVDFSRVFPRSLRLSFVFFCLRSVCSVCSVVKSSWSGYRRSFGKRILAGNRPDSVQQATRTGVFRSPTILVEDTESFASIGDRELKIIHTADWHLCDLLGRIKRYDDFRVRVEAVAGLCAEHAVDVVLIAGDIFSEQAQPEEMTRALQHIHEAFEPFFARGGTILAITGNHDRDVRINMIQAGMSLARPAPADGLLECGRMYVENRLNLVSLQTAAGDRVQFVLLPYPFVSRYIEATDVYRTKEEENRLLQDRAAEWIRDVPSRPSFDPGVPTVLAAHLNVRGSEVHSLYKLDEKDDLVFDLGFIPTTWSYVALGHIHKPQMLGGMANVRYSGSLDRCDFGELGQGKGVVLFELGPAGLRCEPIWLSIPATPLYDIVLESPVEDLPRLAVQYPDHTTAIVRVLATHDPDGPSRDEIARDLRKLFPRIYDLKWTEKLTKSPEAPPSTVNPRANPRQVILEFLADKLKDDPDKDEILALVEPYIAEEERR